MSTVIFAKINVAGFHCWPDAPIHRAYLSLKHRHDFFIIGEKEVTHDDRMIEFHDLCDKMHLAVTALFPKCYATGAIDFGSKSCEAIAAALLNRLDLDACEVSEDGINGARVTRR